jgi:CBS-domain-containing membrane protein
MKQPLTTRRGRFRLLWKRYLLQCLLTCGALFAVLLILDLQHMVVIASIGATSFVVFAMPTHPTAQPRNVICGQMIGLASGSLLALVPHHSHIGNLLIYTGAVGTAYLLMVLTKTEHPPAAGTALGIAITGFYPSVLLTLFACVMMLSLLHWALRDHLTDFLRDG